MDICFLGFAHFAKVGRVVTFKTLYTTCWSSLASLMLVITTSLILSWVPGRSVRGCITFNGLVLSFTETINLRWRYRGVHGPKLCLGSFFSARYVSCFLECKVVALRDAFLTYSFVVCAKYEGISHYFVLHLVRVPAVLDEKSCFCKEGVQWSAILFEITKIVSVKYLVCLGLDMLFEAFPVLVDVFLLFCG